MIEVHAHDVLFGKGKGSYQHEGNVIFRKLIDTYKDQYATCKKGEKRNLAICITNVIRSQTPAGRFLELDTSVGTVGSWVEVDNERAIEKTCQTLRKKRTNTGSTILSNATNVKPKDRFQSNHLLNMSDFSLKSSSLFSSSLSSIKCVSNSHSQLNGKLLETSMMKEQNSKVDLSLHNDVILANLQQYYREKQEWSPLDDHISQCLNDIHETSSNNHMKAWDDEDMKSSQERHIHNKRYFAQERNEFDDVGLTMFMEMEHDSTIENDFRTSGDDTFESFSNEVFV